MTYHQLWHLLVPLYSPNEAKAIARMVFEVSFNLSFADLLCGKDTQLSQEQRAQIQKTASRLAAGEPVQYVLEQADFAARTFKVRSGVLIPRPETEDLCTWIEEHCRTLAPGSKELLDIGTGSGCIAVTMALNLEDTRVTAWDIAPEALSLARENAEDLHAHIDVCSQDALNPPADTEKWHLIVSNPPYIARREAADMHPNVCLYEPHLALFVPDEQPFRFYQAIARYAQNALRHGGSLFFEINPLFVVELKELLTALNYQDIEVKPDRFGRQRFLKATRK